MLIKTERLIASELSLDDANFILRLLNEPTFIEHIGDKGVRNVEDACHYLNTGPLESYKAHGFGLWKVAIKEDATPIGLCGLLKRDVLEDVDIGYALLPEYCGCGYALEVASAVKALAGSRFGLNRLVAVVKDDNEPSIKLLNKLDFAYEGMVRLSQDSEENMLFASAL